MYDEILVPTDGSPAAEAAIDHAVSLAKSYDARLHALYVVDANAYASMEAGSEVVVEALESEGRTAISRVGEAAGDAGIEVEEDLITGTPHRGILEYIDDHDIDLVVMGTHGRTGLDRLLLGSVTERVVRGADVPVMTVHGEESA